MTSACRGVIPGTFIACGEDDNYCSSACWVVTSLTRLMTEISNVTSVMQFIAKIADEEKGKSMGDGMSDGTERREEREAARVAHEDRVHAVVAVCQELEKLKTEIAEHDSQIAGKRKHLAELELWLHNHIK